MIDLTERMYSIKFWDIKEDLDPTGLMEKPFNQLVGMLLNPKSLADELLKSYEMTKTRQKRRNEFLKQIIKEDHDGDDRYM